MFKVNNKNTTTTSLTLFTPHFTPFSKVSTVDCEQINVNGVRLKQELL